MKVVLIGMASVGKSYIGKKLSTKLKYDFVDVDDSLKQKTGHDTVKLLEEVGHEGFLEIENKVFDTVVREAGENTVFAPGGSVIYCESFARLKPELFVIYLVGDDKTIRQRIKSEPRGIVNPRGLDIYSLMQERKVLYEKYADSAVLATKKADEVVDIICDILISKREIC